MQAFLTRHGEESPRTALLRARVDLERFRCVTDKRTPRSELGLPVDAKIILCFGRLVPRKGIHRAIAVLPSIRRRVPHALLVIAGTGPQMRTLKRKSKGSADHIAFMGRTSDEDAAKLYAAADVFTLPVADRWFGLDVEGLGVVLLEAAAACTPAVTGRSGGTAEAVSDGVTGFVVDARDENVLADRISVLLEEPELARSMGEAARAHVDQNFSARNLPPELYEWMSGVS